MSNIHVRPILTAALLLAAACHPVPRETIVASYMTAGPTCSDKGIAGSSYRMNGDEAAQGLEGVRAKAGAGMDPAIDACAARLRAGAPAEREAQRRRLPEEQGRVAAIRADQAYRDLLDAWRTARGIERASGSSD